MSQAWRRRKRGNARLSPTSSFSSGPTPAPWQPSLPGITTPTEAVSSSWDFVDDPPEKFHCGICTCVLHEPHLTDCCGHDFCEACLDKWQNHSKKLECPHCRAPNFHHIINKQTTRNIHKLTVRCTHRGLGCEWEGPLEDLSVHLKSCGYVHMTCQDCSVSLERRHLERHSKNECLNRKATCQYCGQEDLHLLVTSLGHLALCSHYPMHCPNFCKAKEFKRNQLAAHLEQCPLQLVACPFQEAGCGARMRRKDLGEHLRGMSQEHLLGVMAASRETRTRLKRAEEELEEERKGKEARDEQLQAHSQDLRKLKMFQASMQECMKVIVPKLDQILKDPPPALAGPLHSVRDVIENAANPKHLRSTSPIYLTMPHVSRCSEKAREPWLWKSWPFYFEAGYKFLLSAQCPPGSAAVQVKLVLLRGEVDQELAWPCNVSPICVAATPSNTSKAQRYPPQLVARDGTLHRHALKSSPPMHQVVWEHGKLLKFPPPPQYVHSPDSLVFKLECRGSASLSPLGVGAREAAQVPPSTAVRALS